MRDKFASGLVILACFELLETSAQAWESCPRAGFETLGVPQSLFRPTVLTYVDSPTT